MEYPSSLALTSLATFCRSKLLGSILSPLGNAAPVCSVRQRLHDECLLNVSMLLNFKAKFAEKDSIFAVCPKPYPVYTVH